MLSLFIGDDDKVVPPANGVNYYLALNKKGVPSVLHIYPTGGHGWGIREDFLYKSEMQNELTSWLRSFKAPRKDAVRVACIGNSITFGAGIRNRAATATFRTGPYVGRQLLGEKLRSERPYHAEQRRSSLYERTCL